MSRIISIILSIQLSILPVISYAQQENAVTIKKGQPAPFDGTLLDPLSVAKILAEREYEKRKLELEKERELSLQQAKHDLELGNKKIELDIASKKYSTVVSLKENEIDRLQNLIKKNDSSISGVVWLVVGVVAGIGIVMGSAYALSAAK